MNYALTQNGRGDVGAPNPQDRNDALADAEASSVEMLLLDGYYTNDIQERFADAMFEGNWPAVLAAFKKRDAAAFFDLISEKVALPLVDLAASRERLMS